MSDSLWTSRPLRALACPMLLWPVAWIDPTWRGLTVMLLAYGIGYADPFNAVGERRRG